MATQIQIGLDRGSCPGSGWITDHNIVDIGGVHHQTKDDWTIRREDPGSVGAVSVINHSRPRYGGGGKEVDIEDVKLGVEDSLDRRGVADNDDIFQGSSGLGLHVSGAGDTR